MRKRIVIASGGTGGHIKPAEAIADCLSEQADVFFAGVGLSTNRYFNKEKYPFLDVDGANFSKGVVFGGKKIVKGIIAARKFLKDKNASHVIGLGSFHSLPVLLASYSLGIPFTLYEPNTVMGKVNRFFAKRAKRVISLFPESPYGLKGNITALAPSYQVGETLSQENARAFFGLDPNLSTLLVFGGSQGAKTVNELILSVKEFLKGKFQVIHCSGDDSISAKDYEGVRAFVCPYSEHMKEAWIASDLAICRSGAGALREMIAYQKPAILIPFAQAMDNHQLMNAKFMQEVIGGGILLEEKFATKEEIEKWLTLLFSSPLKEEMESALMGYSQKEGKQTLTEAVLEVL